MDIDSTARLTGRPDILILRANETLLGREGLKLLSSYTQTNDFSTTPRVSLLDLNLTESSFRQVVLDDFLTRYS